MTERSAGCVSYSLDALMPRTSDAVTTYTVWRVRTGPPMMRSRIPIEPPLFYRTSSADSSDSYADVRCLFIEVAAP